MINTFEKLTEELNPEQAQAVLNPINVCTKIVAGAGTGKTKIISKRYVKLIKDLIDQGIENPVERILVITFTDKAANEMKTRILQTLKENNISYYGQENRISTIHSFCSKILRRHSIEIGLSPSFKLGKATELAEIYDNIIKKIKYNEYKFIDSIDDIANDLNLTPSILSVEAITEFIAIKNLDDILAYILPAIQKVKSLGLEPKEFLNITRKAIKDYSEKLKKFPCGFETKNDYISEITNLLSDYMYKVSAFDENLLDKICKDKIIAKNGQRKPEKWVLGEIISDIDKITNIELKLADIIALIYGIYQKQLIQKDVVDYDDLINGTLQILKNDAIKSYYKKYFKHLIIDEFQDTSLAQMKLMLALLAEDAPNITIVGDKKQSIYSFRHAKMENIDNLHTTIQNLYQKKYPEIKLKTNYRSTPEILKTVNFVTENELNLNEQLEVNPNEDFSKINSFVNLYKLINIKSSKELNSSQGKFIAEKILENKEKENLNFKDFAILTRVNSEIDDIENELKKYGIPSTKKVNTNYFQQDEIVNISALFKITQNLRNEYALIRILSIKFSDKDIYNLKKSLDILKSEDKNFDDYNFADKILYFIDKNKLDELNADKELITYIKILYDTIKYINNNKKSMDLLLIAEKLISNISPYNILSGSKKVIADNNIEIFKKIVSDYAKQETYTSIKKFNEYFEQIKDDKNFMLPSINSDEVDAVNLLTIHASKGLEYPYVFLTAAKNKSQPSKSYMEFELNQDKGNFGIILKSFNDNKTAQSSIYNRLYNDINQNDEALRLFYVALTRAKRFLNILTFEAINSKIKPADYINNLEKFLVPEILDINEMQLDKKLL